jgi:hypothetical protein
LRNSGIGAIIPLRKNLNTLSRFPNLRKNGKEDQETWIRGTKVFPGA